jgi:hypothetical protein
LRAVFLAIGSVIAAACSRPVPPTLTPERIAVTRIDTAGIALDIAMAVTNPNSVDLTADDVTGHLVLEGAQDLGSVMVQKSVTLPAGRTTEVDVPLALRWTDMGVLAQLAARAGAVPYSVDGTLELGGSLHVAVPFHVAGAITRDQILAAAVQSLPLPR